MKHAAKPGNVRVVLIGPVCRDESIIFGRTVSGMGNTTYYSGNPFRSLGAQVDVFVTYGDEPASWIAENLPGIGVHHIEGGKTLFHRLLYGKASERRTEVVREQPRMIRDADLQDLGQYDLVVFAPLYHDDLHAEVFSRDYGRAKTAMTNFGPFNYLVKGETSWRNPENYHRIVCFVDFLFLDRTELSFVSGKDDLEEGVDMLMDHGAKTVIITEAEKGSHIFSGEERLEIPAFTPKEIIDPTGAGDTYLAGFLSALQEGSDLEEAGMFGAMCATMCIERKGALRASADEVIARLSLAGKRVSF